MAKKQLDELETELADVTAAEAAIADDTDGGDAAIEAATLVTEQADVVVAADKLSICDFGMVSNDMARAILKAQGKTVKFEEPEVVEADYNMRPYK